MAKIKDCVFIEREYLDSLLKEFNDFLIENGNSRVERKIINNHIVVMNKIINKTNPLEPIIKDAFHAENTWNVDFNEYLNKTEL